MPQHAAQTRRWDTLAAYSALAVAWFRLLLGLDTGKGQHEMVSWPTEDPDFGATPEFGDALHAMNQDPVVGPEVRA